MELKKFLAEWTLKFLQNKDALFKKIISVESLNGIFDFKITYSDKMQYGLCLEKFNDIFSILEKQGKGAFMWVTVINSKENFDFLLNHWKEFIEFANLTVCFVSPFSLSEKKWIVKPALHALVSDENSLTGGLKALSESVEQCTIEELKSRLHELS